MADSITPLPTAASKPVRNPRHRGSYPHAIPYLPNFRSSRIAQEIDQLKRRKQALDNDMRELFRESYALTSRISHLAPELRDWLAGGEDPDQKPNATLAQHDRND